MKVLVSNKWKKAGTFGDVSTHSFYSHHISTMEGGMALTDNFETYCILKSIRAHGWARDLLNQKIILILMKKEIYIIFISWI